MFFDDVVVESISKCKIDYKFEENPQWRRDELPTTTEMVREITEWRKRFASPSESVQSRIDYHAKTAAVDYVHNLNKGEMVGTQTRGDTQKVIEEVLNSEPDEREGKSKDYIETVNIYLAMSHLFELDREMEKKGLITVQQVSDTHRILMKDLHRGHGEIRKRNACTRWNGKDHDYPPHEDVEAKLYALIDHYNICIESLHRYTVEPEQYTAYVFKCAAGLMFDFIDTHPYMDGNGRMCRLLANYVLGLITPFPVAIYHSDESQSARDDYVNAIVRCHEHPEEGPRALATMLVEGAWYGWTKLIAFVEKGTKVSVVIKKSLFLKEKEEYVSSKLNHVWKALETKGTKMSKEEVIKKVVEVVPWVDTTLLFGPVYKEAKVQLENDIHLFLQVHN